MKRLMLMVVAAFFASSIFAQKGITFKVEDLSKPTTTLPMESISDVYEKLISQNLRSNGIGEKENDISSNVLAIYPVRDSLVNFGSKSFLCGMYKAYAGHRPFVLSPDMIWLLISQGFAQHVNINPEKMRSYFVNFEGKKTLTVYILDDMNSPTFSWENIFNQFSRQIANNTTGELVEILSCDFTTTTSAERIASQITMMNAMSSYFEYYSVIVCGIPEITLKGTPADWQKVLDKARMLKQYELGWWISELEPVLEEIVKTSKGNINKGFWKNMFKYHESEMCGKPDIIDGWIVKFYPYSDKGIKNDLKELKGISTIPDEIVKVNLNVSDLRSEDVIHELEIWSGFVGLKQDTKTFALTPQIGWMIRAKDEGERNSFEKKLREINAKQTAFGICLKVSELPKELKNIGDIYRLRLTFTKKVFIPEWMKGVKIGELSIYGDITQTEISKIVKWFPDTRIYINSDLHNEGLFEPLHDDGIIIDWVPDKILESAKITEEEFTSSDSSIKVVVTEPIVDASPQSEDLQDENMTVIISAIVLCILLFTGLVWGARSYRKKPE